MGAWGHRSFENDSALDWLGDLEAGTGSISDALDGITDAPLGAYLDADVASAALAAAELVSAAVGQGDDRLLEQAASWLRDHRDEVRAIGAEQARLAVHRLYERSELRELWDENGDDTDWHADVRELLRRLS